MNISHNNGAGHLPFWGAYTLNTEYNGLVGRYTVAAGMADIYGYFVQRLRGCSL